VAIFRAGSLTDLNIGIDFWDISVKIGGWEKQTLFCMVSCTCMGIKRVYIGKKCVGKIKIMYVAKHQENIVWG